MTISDVAVRSGTSPAAPESPKVLPSYGRCPRPTLAGGPRVTSSVADRFPHSSTSVATGPTSALAPTLWWFALLWSWAGGLESASRPLGGFW
jgi:hypothetical protein